MHARVFWQGCRVCRVLSARFSRENTSPPTRRDAPARNRDDGDMEHRRGYDVLLQHGIQLEALALEL